MSNPSLVNVYRGGVRDEYGDETPANRLVASNIQVKIDQKVSRFRDANTGAVDFTIESEGSIYQVADVQAGDRLQKIDTGEEWSVKGVIPYQFSGARKLRLILERVER